MQLIILDEISLYSFLRLQTISTRILHTGNLLDPVHDHKCIWESHFHWVVGWTYLCHSNRNLEDKTGRYAWNIEIKKFRLKITVVPEWTFNQCKLKVLNKYFIQYSIIWLRIYWRLKLLFFIFLLSEFALLLV